MFNNFKISLRLSVFAIFATVQAFMLGWLGLHGMNVSNDALQNVYENQTVAIQQLAVVQEMDAINEALLSKALGDPDLKNIPTYLKRVDDNSVILVKNWLDFTKSLLNEEESRLVKEVDQESDAVVHKGLIPIKEALSKGDIPQASTIMYEVLPTLYIPFRKSVDRLMHIQVEEAKTNYEASISRYTNYKFWSITVFSICLLFTIQYAIIFIKYLKESLAIAITTAQTIADGNLKIERNVTSLDEIGELLRALEGMRKKLSLVVSSVRQGSEGVSTASAEIASGNSDLSSRTESQASALEQTAASMQELSNTVNKNSEAASSANVMASEVSSLASKGGVVVSDVVTTMNSINESSAKISDIISVIDGIAFQTNILALNAAVEAARAGEHGKGFAVVATEVRSLATRSATAAKEIKMLINASTETIERGTDQVAKAGATMTDIVDAVTKVSQLMINIATSSKEQAASVGEVGQAVNQMDMVTQQNAALVEEMAAAAMSLKAQAEELVGVVSVFRV
jgi:methyl-accepting chemotaxis protein-1 (serine sensor receptor)